MNRLCATLSSGTDWKLVFSILCNGLVEKYLNVGVSFASKTSDKQEYFASFYSLIMD